MFHVVLKTLEGPVLLKSEISFVLSISCLAGFNFSIKTYSFSILQIIDVIEYFFPLHPVTGNSKDFWVVFFFLVF